MKSVVNKDKCGRSDYLLVADAHAECIYLIAENGEIQHIVRDVVLAEHAGVLALPDKRFAFVDDGGGYLVVLRVHDGEMEVERYSVAIPGEHLSSDPSGRYIAVSTGLGRSFEPWSDLVTVVDLRTGTSRRIRTRNGEPGVIVTANPDPTVVLRHREPGGLESIKVSQIMAAGGHCPPLRGELYSGFPDDGHGDAYDPATQQLFFATGPGVQRYVVAEGGTLEQGKPLSWGHDARAYFLRFYPGSRTLTAIMRSQGDKPKQWHEWSNWIWCYDIDTDTVRTTPAGPGLIYRFGLTRDGIAVARIHPDGDELTVYRRLNLERMNTWPLESMVSGPEPGREPWDNSERRAIAAHPGNGLVAVTRGGHGEVTVVDTEEAHTEKANAEPQTFSVPSSLTEGGYLAWLSAEDEYRENVGR